MLIEKHAGYARSVAVKTAHGLPVEIEDAEQIGLEALIVAANRFDLDKHDPTLGDLDTNFKSFAYMRIYGAVVDEARRNTFVKRRGLEKGVDIKLISLDAPLRPSGFEDEGFHLELAALSGDPDLVLDFEDGFKRLTEREKYVVLALASGVKGRELAAELSVTESRISQIYTDAKSKLNNYMEVAA